MNKIEFIAMGHLFGIVLPWLCPHCKGIHPMHYIDLDQCESPEGFRNSSPVDYDVQFEAMTAQYRDEIRKRKQYRALISRRAILEGCPIPTYLGSQFTCLVRKTALFHVALDSARPCMPKLLAKGKEKMADDVDTIFCMKRKRALTHDEFQHLWAHGPRTEEVGYRLKAHFAALEHTSWRK